MPQNHRSRPGDRGHIWLSLAIILVMILIILFF